MPKPKTIAIVAGQLVLGGAERQLYLFLANLDRARFRPVVLTLHPGCADYWEQPIQMLGIDVLPVPRLRSKLRRVSTIRLALKRYRPTLVHGWHLFASPYAGAAARLTGARASLGSARGSFESYATQTIAVALTRLLTDGLVVNSPAVARKIEGAGGFLGNHRVFAVPNAVEPVSGERERMRSRLAERFHVPDDRVWLGSVGRFQRSKQFDLLIEMTAWLAGRGENVHLVLVGYGEGMEGLRATAKALGVESRVTFTGEDAEARSWMPAFDVFCFASIDEGLPNVVMEAAAAAVPVLAWRTDFIRELLGDPPCAVVAEPGNAIGFREGLATLIGSREMRRDLGAKAQNEMSMRFGVPSMVERLSAVYERVLETKGDRPG